MLERGSPRAALIGRWGMALTLVTGAVLIGRLIRNFPYLLPNRQRLKHRKTRLALQQPGSGDQRLKGRLSGLAGQMRQIDSMNEPG